MSLSYGELGQIDDEIALLEERQERLTIEESRELGRLNERLVMAEIEYYASPAFRDGRR